jgi:hypothetical protein
MWRFGWQMKLFLFAGMHTQDRDELQAFQLFLIKNIIDFSKSQMRISFIQRVEEKSKYVHSYPEQIISPFV